MSKRKAVLFLSCLMLVGTLQADNLLINGNFEQTPGGTGWTQWWGGNSNRYVLDPLEGDYCAGVWWHDDGIVQTITIGPGMYEFGGKIMTTQGMVNRRGVIQAEFGGKVQQLDIVPGDAVNEWHIASPQDGFPNSAIIDNTTFGATTLTINLMMVSGASPSGIVFYDDLYLGPLGISKQAKFPDPYPGKIVPPSTNLLRWTNPDPNNPADTILCDVYLEADDGDPNFASSPIASGITANSIAVSSLLPNTKYTWRVDCTDPHGDPITKGAAMTQGAVWTFTTTNDIPPVIEAGPNQYNWLTMEDGDGDPTKVTFTLNGQITDDNQSPLTILWSLIYSEQDPATIVAIANSDSKDTAVTINGTGLYRFQLAVDDAYAHLEDTLDVYVTGTACEAARIDPDDHYQTYEFIGDVTNDCKVNLDDLAVMAATWLDCLSAKLDCIP